MAPIFKAVPHTSAMLAKDCAAAHLFLKNFQSRGHPRTKTGLSAKPGACPRQKHRLLDQANGVRHAECLAFGGRDRPHNAENQMHDAEDRHQQGADQNEHQYRGNDIANDCGNRPVQGFLGLVENIGVILLDQIHDQTGDKPEKQGSDLDQQADVFGFLIYFYELVRHFVSFVWWYENRFFAARKDLVRAQLSCLDGRG